MLVPSSRPRPGCLLQKAIASRPDEDQSGQTRTAATWPVLARWMFLGRHRSSAENATRDAERGRHGITTREFLSAFSGVPFCAMPATGQCPSLCDQLQRKASRRRRGDRGNAGRQAKAPKPKRPRIPNDANQRSSLLRTESLQRSIAHRMLRRKSDGVTPTVRRNEVVNELVSAKPSIRPTCVTERVRSSSKVLARSMRRPMW
jgi:hypothetical protein